MGTISFEHLKKNLLSGNYDKYHFPLFLRNSNINFMSYASRYDFFGFFFLSLYFFHGINILFFFLSIHFSMLFYHSFRSLSLSNVWNVCLLLLRVWFSLWWQSIGIRMQQQIQRIIHRSHEAKGFYSVIRWHIWL